jgi:hypothetical protein
VELAVWAVSDKIQNRSIVLLIFEVSTRQNKTECHNSFNNKYLTLCVLCTLCGFEKSGLSGLAAGPLGPGTSREWQASKTNVVRYYSPSHDNVIPAEEAYNRSRQGESCKAARRAETSGPGRRKTGGCDAREPCTHPSGRLSRFPHSSCIPPPAA